MANFTYDVESIKKIEASAEIFRDMVPAIDEAIVMLTEMAKDTGMPLVEKSAVVVQNGWENSFKVVIGQMVETLEKDAQLWKNLAKATGVE